MKAVPQKKRGRKVCFLHTMSYFCIITQYNHNMEAVIRDAMYSEPNAETAAAINEARSGKYAGTIDASDFDSFMKSINDIE